MPPEPYNPWFITSDAELQAHRTPKEACKYAAMSEWGQEDRRAMTQLPPTVKRRVRLTRRGRIARRICLGCAAGVTIFCAWKGVTVGVDSLPADPGNSPAVAQEAR